MMKYLSESGLLYFWGKIKSTISGKQDKLVSGTSIRTINGESVLGSGNLSISFDVNVATGELTMTTTTTD